MMMQHRFCGLALLVALVSQPVNAEEFGKVTFNFDDEEREWFTKIDEVRGKTRASARLRISRLVNTITIKAYEEPRPPWSEFLSIETSYSKGFTGKEEHDYARPVSVNINFFTDGMTGPVWNGRDEQVEILSYDFSGAVGQITASFSATLCYAEEMYADLDESSCQPISGTIETLVQLPEEG